MRVLKLVLPVAVCLAFLGSSDSAHAIDPSLHVAEAAGSVCQPRSGTASYNDFGVVFNDSTTTWLQVDCPVPFIVDTSYGDPIHVGTYVTGNGSPISCSIFAEKLSAFPSSPTFFSASTSTSGTGAIELGVNLNVFEGLALGDLHVHCALPPKTASGAATIRGFVTVD